MVGSALAAGFGRINVTDVQDMLQNPDANKGLNYRMAPACGLYLTNLHYDKDGFVSKDVPVLHEEETDLET